MAEYKIVLNDPKTGKSYQKELKEQAADQLKGKKIGDAVKGDLLGLSGYEFKITGGSDSAGFPMRADNPGINRKRVLIMKGSVGLRKAPKGIKKRRTVCGNIITETMAQVNMKITKHGSGPIAEEAPKEEAAKEGEAPKEEKAEAPKEEKSEPPKEEKKEAPKEEPSKEEKKEEAPKEEKKEKVKEEKPEEPKEEKKEEAPKEEAPSEEKKEEAPKEEKAN
ncbi:30S ribosomal protein S6e [Nanoarchaeota archaeon]